MEESRPFLTSSPNPTQETYVPNYQAVDINTTNKKKNQSGNNNTSYYSSDSDSEQELIGPEATSSSTSSNSSETSIKVNQVRRYIRMALNIISQLGLFIYFGTLATAIYKAPWVYPYSWHPICMGLYGFVATEAILILQTAETATQRQSARNIHGYLQTLALIFSLVGFTAIYDNKERLKKEHFLTNHALMGCTSIFIFFFQVLFGCLVAYLPRRVFAWIGHARIVRIHRVTGYISIVSLWSTLWLAVLTNWVKKNFGNEWIFFLGMGMLAVGLVGQIKVNRLYVSHKTQVHNHSS